jgi:hypothetical protein
MSKAIIHKHQTLLDVALQQSGSTEAFFNLAFINGFALTDDVSPGTELLLPDVIDFKTQQYFQDSIYKPSTGPILIPVIQGGIELWGIETDFIIS